MDNIFVRIRNSFLQAWHGQEDLQNIVWWWGILTFPIAFLLTKLIRFNEILAIDIILSALAIIYYIWHIIVLHKCSPKIPKLNLEGQEMTKEERRKEFAKSFGRKLFLKEPITKWNTTSFVTVIDIYIITVFVGYIII
jgi:hypothetical protein